MIVTLVVVLRLEDSDIGGGVETVEDSDIGGCVETGNDSDIGGGLMLVKASFCTRSRLNCCLTAGVLSFCNKLSFTCISG